MLKKCHLVSLCFFLMSIPIVGCTLEPLSRVGSVNCEGAKSITTIIDGKAETFKCAEFDDDGECSIPKVIIAIVWRLPIVWAQMPVRSVLVVKFVRVGRAVHRV